MNSIIGHEQSGRVIEIYKDKDTNNKQTNF